MTVMIINGVIAFTTNTNQINVCDAMGGGRCETEGEEPV